MAVLNVAFSSSSLCDSESLILDASVYALVLTVFGSKWPSFLSSESSDMGCGDCDGPGICLALELDLAHAFPPARCVRGFPSRRKAKFPLEPEQMPRGSSRLVASDDEGRCEFIFG